MEKKIISKIKSAKLLENIFGSKGHWQLVEKMDEILIFLIQTKNLVNEEIDIIWDSIYLDSNAKKFTMALLSKIAIYFTESNYNYLSSKLSRSKSLLIKE